MPTLNAVQSYRVMSTVSPKMRMENGSSIFSELRPLLLLWEQVRRVAAVPRCNEKKIVVVEKDKDVCCMR